MGEFVASIIVIAFFILLGCLFYNGVTSIKENRRKKAMIHAAFAEAARKAALLPVINHLKQFFAKFEYYPSEEKLSSIIANAAPFMDNNDQLMLFLLRSIPENCSSTEVFLKKIHKAKARILKNCESQDVASALDEIWAEEFSDADESDRDRLIQMQNDILGELPVFRLNYECCATILLLSFCDGFFATSYDDLNKYEIYNFMCYLYDFGVENGYVSEDFAENSKAEMLQLLEEEESDQYDEDDPFIDNEDKEASLPISPLNKFKNMLRATLAFVDTIEFLDSRIQHFDFITYILFKMRMQYMLLLRDPKLITELDKIWLSELETHYEDIPNVNLIINHRLDQYEEAWTKSNSDQERLDGLSFILEQSLFKGADLDYKGVVIKGMTEVLALKSKISTYESMIMKTVSPVVSDVTNEMKQIKA